MSTPESQGALSNIDAEDTEAIGDAVDLVESLSTSVRRGYKISQPRAIKPIPIIVPGMNPFPGKIRENRHDIPKESVIDSQAQEIESD